MSPIFYFETAAAFCSLFLLNNKPGKGYVFITGATWLTVIVEYIALYLKDHEVVNNHLYYNILIPSVIILVALSYHQQFLKPRIKNTLPIVLSVYLIVSVTNIFVTGYHTFSRYNYIIGGLLLSTIAYLFLVEQIRQPPQKKLYQQPMFYISCGVLTTYLPKSILYSFFPFFINDEHSPFTKHFFTINLFLSIPFYTLICIAAFCNLKGTRLRKEL